MTLASYHDTEKNKTTFDIIWNRSILGLPVSGRVGYEVKVWVFSISVVRASIFKFD